MVLSVIGPPGRIWSSLSGTISTSTVSSSDGAMGRTRRGTRLRTTSSSSPALSPMRTATPYRKSVTKPSWPNLYVSGAVKTTPSRSRFDVSIRSLKRSAFTFLRVLAVCLSPIDPSPPYRRGLHMICAKRCATRRPGNDGCRSVIRQRADDDVVDVARERRRGRYAPQGRLRALASACFERTPRPERAHDAGRNLGIFLIEREHEVGDEVVAGTVDAIELGVVRLRERADERSHTVGIGQRERGMRRERAHALKRARIGNRRLQREPFVDDQRIAGVARVEIVQRLRPLGPV